MSNFPAIAYSFLTTGNGGFYGNTQYCNATLRFFSIQDFANYGEPNKFGTEKLFEFAYQTNVAGVDDQHNLTNIQPAAHYQALERRHYTRWYGEKLEIEAKLYNFGTISKEVAKVIAKVEKTIEKYNLHYVHKCPLELMLGALVKAGYQQIYSSRHDWFIHEKGVFTREDRDYSKEPDNWSVAPFPWDNREPVTA